MIKSDIHTHSSFSTDGRAALSDMAAAAREKGMEIYAAAEHFDLDEYSIGMYGSMDERAYFSCARKLQKEVCDERFIFLAGGEFNYVNEREIIDKFFAIEAEYKPDFVINSVHVVDGIECFESDYFMGKSKEYAYSRYLEKVRESLDAPYKYDIIGHIGYVSRHAPYEDALLRYEDFPDLFDDILRTAIAKGVIIEVNSSTRGASGELLPGADILTRYRMLGGTKVSFGSDAHNTDRIGEKRELASAVLKSIGFTHLTIPTPGGEIEAEL